MMQDELLQLRNLGKTSVQWLHAVGVHTRDQLVDKGPVNIYQAVKNRGFRANRVLLYALQGALLDVHWSELEPEVKARLLQEAESPIHQLRMSE